jgi:hypothetical protein
MNAWQIVPALAPVLFSLLGLAMVVLGTWLIRKALDIRDVSTVMSIRNHDFAHLFGRMEEHIERETGEKAPAELVTHRLLAEMEVDEHCSKLRRKSSRYYLYALLLSAAGMSIVFNPLVDKVIRWFS